jgi:hypothetical protein
MRARAQNTKQRRKELQQQQCSNAAGGGVGGGQCLLELAASPFIGNGASPPSNGRPPLMGRPRGGEGLTPAKRKGELVLVGHSIQSDLRRTLYRMTRKAIKTKLTL